LVFCKHFLHQFSLDKDQEYKSKKQKGYLGDIAPPTSNTASPVSSRRIVYIPQAVSLCTSRCRNLQTSWTTTV